MRMQPGFNNQYGMNQGGGPFMNNMGNGNKQAMYQQQMMQRSPAQQPYAQQYMKRPYPGHPGPNNFNQVWVADWLKVPCSPRTVLLYPSPEGINE